MIHVIPTGKNQRLRRWHELDDDGKGAAAPIELPALSAAQRQLLHDWLQSSDAAQRQWQSLLDVAGTQRLTLAQELAELLCATGWMVLKEKREHHQWQIARVLWPDVSHAQTLMGIPSKAIKESRKQSLQEQLQQLAQEHPWLVNATQHLLAGNLPVATLLSRSQLLHAIAQWHSEQRQGLRQDFALAARQDTKGISSTEWDWLAEHLDLESLGIERFAPIFWLAGAISFHNPLSTFRCSPEGFGFLGLPSRQLQAPWQVCRTPERYWLIENRASFERQAQQLEADVCLIWLPGRPSGSWQQAITWLLSQAPAPAHISCDPDPAGIDIALTAGRLWSEAGLTWQPERMGVKECAAATPRALSTYDLARLEQLAEEKNLPETLRELCQYMHRTQTKAEQEGWL